MYTFAKIQAQALGWLPEQPMACEWRVGTFGPTPPTSEGSGLKVDLVTIVQ